ncbi:hypothetical protein Nepgr_028615 [Nepenthes gracilis]|uniref:RING-type E3 ubiquitin transferase n=1 Tax=Nepenthes gracilis TaxID=150966 RepID=A0AAD3Y2A1_NEPGR|nr:hypothetical protein Nepgr_028615 [Nepenthes gracilis]
MATTSSTAEQPWPPQQHYSSPPVAALVAIVVLIIFCAGIFSLYFCKCLMDNVINSMSIRQTPGGTPATRSAGQPPGLDPSIISSFPTFPYYTVKEYRRERYGLQCAICLCDFDDDDLLRLLTGCSHVFHQECIDLWLKSHKSCPICRRSLDCGDEKSPPESAPAAISVDENREENDDTFSHVIKEDEDREQEGVGRSGSPPLSGENEEKPCCDDAFTIVEVGKFSRSHSTGHSIVRTAAAPTSEFEDEFTLRLPVEAKEAIMRRHQVTLSSTTFEEHSRNSTRNHGCFGEISGDDNKV